MAERVGPKHSCDQDKTATKVRSCRRDAINVYNGSPALIGSHQWEWERYRSASAYVFAKELDHIRVEMSAMYIAASKHEVCQLCFFLLGVEYPIQFSLNST